MYRKKRKPAPKRSDRRRRAPKAKAKTHKTCQVCRTRFEIKTAETVNFHKKYSVFWCPHCNSVTAHTITDLREFAWRVFAWWVKNDECDERGICTCVTCGERLPVTSPKMHAGHLLAGRTKGVLFLRPVVHCQCLTCNFFLGGNPDAYWPYMLNRYGPDQIEQWRIKKHEVTGQWTEDELRAVVARYWRADTLTYVG